MKIQNGLIRVGKDFYRQGHKNESINGLNELVYATFKKSDAKQYETALPGKIRYTINNSEKVKIAGHRSAKKIYDELMRTDDVFRSHFNGQSYENFNGTLGQANTILIENNIKLKDIYASPFFEELKKKGYSAVVDTQDKFAKVPVILINDNDGYKIKR